ncbi:NAD-dependent epimerase/dehydratase family protein [Dyadobacter fermentans]|uniref:NAD-dependent epimerase/dehydratase family protein n=1 Tax=Dyadobacter fermentans TaxID=94254 RepID=UPI00019B5907|nr:NAD-dependent epimerase/dehydratase family protein [Dyadobacter fermentans]
MKIVIVGASGTIGKHVVDALKSEHEIITAGSKSGDYQVDMAIPDSIKAFFEQIGSFDALVCAAGDAHFGPLTSMTDQDFRKGVDGS